MENEEYCVAAQIAGVKLIASFIKLQWAFMKHNEI